MDIELCRKFFASRQNYTIFAGFSGGADSTAALLTALHFSAEFNLNIVAVHFNHHLRGSESDADALWCRAFAEKHGVDFQLIDLNIAEKGGIEDAARQARFSHWKKLTENRSNCAVMLGHHADDCIENFFLRTLRGSNLSGLLAPRAEHCIENIDIFRPLLSFPRRDIEAFLLKHGISDWRIDSTNKLADCSRNKLRLNILPQLFELFPGAYDGMCQCLKVLEQDAAFLDEMALEKFDLKKINTRSYWQQLPPALAVRILRLWKGEIPSSAFCERFFFELQQDWSDEPREIPWNANESLLFQKGLVFWQNSENNLVPMTWFLEKQCFQWGDWEFQIEKTSSIVTTSKYEAIFDACQLGDKLEISLPLPGERMSVFGSQKTEKIKKLRIDSKIPAFYHLPVVRNSAGEIVWAPGIRHSALAAVQNDPENAVKITIRSAKFGIGIGIN